MELKLGKLNGLANSKGIIYNLYSTQNIWNISKITYPKDDIVLLKEGISKLLIFFKEI